MIRIAISGICGKMGRTLLTSISERTDCEVCCGIDIGEAKDCPVPVYKTPAEMKEKPDVIIDYSHPSTLRGLLDYAVSTGTPVVLATTGYTDEQLAEIRQASEKAAFFSSFNMSIGIQLLIALSKKAAAVLGNAFDIEIIEKHHNQKIDAPSGTALMLANALCEASDPKKHPVYERHSVRRKREVTEIGIHSVRGGTIVGEHEVLFAGPDECISLTHTASSKRVFAEGSVNAACFLIGRKPGLYDMTDLLNEA
ncbi:MAG: 4-hydroxy-tetrahydrodipicolinate reductase [Oscillospiraceae bacterium]|nr:4-hydroxy-tetrahydrodipicolinate reductase [Oscillospiraceae bacterium]